MDAEGIEEQVPVLVAKELVPSVLELIGGEIEALTNVFHLDYGSYHEVVQDLYQARRQLWVLVDEDFQTEAWLVTKIRSMPTGSRLVYDMVGGRDIDHMLTFLPNIEEWAKSYGVVESIAYARPGLRKKLKDFGFRHTCDVVFKSLADNVQ